MEAKFLVTDEAIRLARWLRLAGYDTAIANAKPLSEFYRKAYNERRIVVTRNRHVLAGCLFRVIHLDSEHLEEQLRQLIRQLRLPLDEAKAFTRCDVCNVKLEPIEKGQVQPKVPPYVFRTQEAFHRCPSCQRIYWAATHWERARRFFQRVREQPLDHA